MDSGLANSRLALPAPTPACMRGWRRGGTSSVPVLLRSAQTVSGRPLAPGARLGAGPGKEKGK